MSQKPDQMEDRFENVTLYQDRIRSTEDLMNELGIEFWLVGSQNDRTEPIPESEPMKRHGLWFMTHFLSEAGLEMQDILGLMTTFYRDSTVSKYFNMGPPEELSDQSLLNRSDTDLAVVASIEDLKLSGFIERLLVLWPKAQFKLQADFASEKLFPKINIFLRTGLRHKVLEIAPIQSWIERFEQRALLPYDYGLNSIDPVQFYTDLNNEMEGPFYRSDKLRMVILSAIQNRDIEELRNFWPLITYYLLLMQREFKKGAEFGLPMREKIFTTLDYEIPLAWQVARIYLDPAELAPLDQDLRLKSFSYFLRIILADPSYVVPIITAPESSLLLFSPTLYFKTLETLQSNMQDKHNESPRDALKFNFSLFSLYMLGWNKEFSSYLNDSEWYRTYEMIKLSPYFKPMDREPIDPKSADYKKVTDELSIFRRGVENTLCALFFFLGIKPSEVEEILKELPINIDGTPNSHLRMQGYNGGQHLLVDRTVETSRLQEKLRLTYQNFYDSYWVDESVSVDWNQRPPKMTYYQLPLENHAFKLRRFMTETGAPILLQLEALFESLDYGCRLEKYNVWRTLSHLGANRML